jgi:hypothetical protein
MFSCTSTLDVRRGLLIALIRLTHPTFFFYLSQTHINGRYLLHVISHMFLIGVMTVEVLTDYSERRIGLHMYLLLAFILSLVLHQVRKQPMP